jgi:hypothetical protein
MMKSEKKYQQVIPDSDVQCYPFNYMYLCMPVNGEDIEFNEKEEEYFSTYLFGNMPTLQNAHARVETFYKCISRL